MFHERRTRADPYQPSDQILGSWLNTTRPKRMILLLLDMSCFEFWSLHSLSPPSLFPLCIRISGRRLDCNLLLLTCRKNKTKFKKLNKSTSYCLGVDTRVTCVHTQGLILFSILLGFFLFLFFWLCFANWVIDPLGFCTVASIELCNFPLSPSLGIWAFWQVLAWCHLKSQQLFEWKFPSQVLWKFPSDVLRKLVLKNLPRHKLPSEVCSFPLLKVSHARISFCFHTTCTIVRERENRRELCVCVCVCVSLIFPQKRKRIRTIVPLPFRQ